MSRCLYIMPLVLAAVLAGCASAHRDTTGYALVNEATVNAPFEEAWQITKTVLREQELDIYTRDKRGYFVAYTLGEKRWRVAPERQKFTISLQEVSPSATHVTIETVDQEYGVTLLTYPDWHDRPATGDELAKTILQGIEGKAAGA